ncbi:hypothetical protein MVEN_00685300 [Mycena venus]|uniref:Uncharacterized protein n=1 Tax=Mycena venus TaxID=2733690 RepID=A0A8H6YKI8_9AGAR|nr:hypothetical protein MVEN_00685300 [Mycena venus]
MWEYWLPTAGLGGVAPLAVFLVRLVMVPKFQDALLAALAMAFLVAVSYLLLPILGIAFILVTIGSIWVVIWVPLWWFIYILAFFPQMKIFPPTITSVLEIDQIAALLGVSAVAAIRTLRAIYKAIHPSAHSLPEETSVSIWFNTRYVPRPTHWRSFLGLMEIP